MRLEEDSRYYKKEDEKMTDFYHVQKIKKSQKIRECQCCGPEIIERITNE